jgi:hypothetical protein
VVGAAEPADGGVPGPHLDQAIETDDPQPGCGLLRLGPLGSAMVVRHAGEGTSAMPAGPGAPPVPAWRYAQRRFPVSRGGIDMSSFVILASGRPM